MQQTAQHLFRVLHVKGVRHLHVATDGLHDLLDIHGLYLGAHGGETGAGMGLEAGHGGGGVVQHHQQHVGVVIGGVHQTGHDGVEEGGVAADSDHLLVQAVVGQLAQALRQVDAGAHAVAGLEGEVAGGLAGHDVAADVAHHGAGMFLLAHHLFQQIERGPVGTAGAEGQVPLRQLQLRGGPLFRQGRAGEGGHGGHHVVRVQFPNFGQRPIGPAGEGDAQLVPPGDGFQIVLQHRVHFLQCQHLFHALQMAEDVLLRQGPHGGQTQQAHPVLQAQPADGLLGVEPAGAAGHDQLFGLFRTGVVVEGTAFKLLPQSVQLPQHVGMLVGDAHQPVPLAHGLEGMGLFRQGTQGYVAPAVAHPGGEPHDDDLLRPLGELKGVGNHVLGLLHAGGLQHGQAGGHGLIPGVEFIGAGVCAGVVGGYHHQTALHAVLGAAVEGVRHTQKAILLYDAQRPGVGQRRAHAGLHGADLVGGPLRVEIPFPGDLSQHRQHLGGGRARVGRGEVDARLHRSAHNGLVALHQADLTQGVGCHCPFHVEQVTFFSNLPFSGQIN